MLYLFNLSNNNYIVIVFQVGSEWRNLLTGYIHQLDFVYIFLLLFFVCIFLGEFCFRFITVSLAPVVIELLPFESSVEYIIEKVRSKVSDFLPCNHRTQGNLLKTLITDLRGIF